MAVYAKIDSNRPIENGLAVGLAPQNKSTQGAVFYDDRAEKLANMTDLQTRLDARFIHGGSTSWERQSVAAV